MTAVDAADARYMGMALGLARRGLGRVWPNPAVGCVLVREGRVLARGWTQAGGRPHAETEALRRAGSQARGATAYVSLEPCAHDGVTPPCADALIEAGIARCVVALEDPDPRVSGAGVRRLSDTGIAVRTGVCAEEARALNAGFLMRTLEGRPLITLKLASSLDGRIAAHTGESRWITGEAARARVHLMRAEADAVLIGAHTALADDPELTCRLPGLGERSPVRVVMDTRMQLPLTSRLVAGAGAAPTWIVSLPGANRERRGAYDSCGVEIIEVEADAEGRCSVQAAARALARRGITRLLVEGGAALAASLLRADLVDRIAWFRAPSVIGADGLPAAEAMGRDGLAAAPRFRRVSVTPVGEDVLESYAVLA